MIDALVHQGDFSFISGFHKMYRIYRKILDSQEPIYRLNMTEKLFTGTLNKNQNKTKSRANIALYKHKPAISKGGYGGKRISKVYFDSHNLFENCDF